VGFGAALTSGTRFQIDVRTELAFANEQRQDAPETTRRAAIGKMASKRSTARRITMSACPKKSSARVLTTSISVNVSARATSFRKVAFL